MIETDWRLIREQPDNEEDDRVCECGARLDSLGRCVEWRSHLYYEYED